MIYVCVIKLALIIFDPSPNNAVIKVSLILALLPRFFIVLHLGIRLRTIYRSFGIRSGMTGVRVATAFRGSSEGGLIRGIHSPS
jgi:hypothetical protein